MTNTAKFIPAHSVGDLVQVVPAVAAKYRGIVFRVDEIPGGRRTKLSATPIKGGPSIKGDPSLFIGPSDPSWVGPRDVEVPDAEVVAIDLGSLVTVPGRSGFWVVIKMTADKLNLVRLGGDGGRYLRNVSRTLVTLVPEFHVVVD